MARKYNKDLYGECKELEKAIMPIPKREEKKVELAHIDYLSQWKEEKAEKDAKAREARMKDLDISRIKW